MPKPGHRQGHGQVDYHGLREEVGVDGQVLDEVQLVGAEEDPRNKGGGGQRVSF
ncbi:MAG: hypothetical protein H6558_15495 [Lewinellaceae bacterium]|nr:hypothetical protein [Lewinellaceae bacterium]